MKLKWSQLKPRLLRWLKRLGIFLLAALGLFLLLNIIFPLPDRISYSTIITDNRGQMIHAFLTPDEKWRMKTELSEISPLLRKTILAKEDQYFYWHPGVNPLAVGRAFFRNIFSGRRTSGASTITMQVARAMERRPRTIWSKLVEMFRAFQLEWKYDKNEILQLYLNLVPYGGNIEGVKAASLIYFKKDPDHLSLAEITALSIIPNRPSSLVMGRHNDRIVEERNRWLHRFAEEKVFTEKKIEDALAEPLVARRETLPRLAPHLAYKLRRRGGTEIQSTIDLNMQLKTETLVAEYSRAQKLRQISNAAVVVIDNQTHRVLSYVGSADFTDTTDDGQVNGANAVRQPGSTLKPILYALCFDQGLLTPRQVVSDVPVNYQGYAPENYDRRFHGYVTIEKSLEQSLNIPAVNALQQLGTDRLIQALSLAQFKQVEHDRRKLGLSMILGGCGTTLEELTGLFSSFAHEGKFYAPVYTQTQATRPGQEIISPAACFMINEILSKINRPDFPLNWTATERMPKIAWKTGTSYGRRDAWSIGYNRKYTVGVWLGNFSGVGVSDLSGANIATPLLFKIFNTIDYDSDEAWFTAPADCAVRQVCSETGMIPGPHCTQLVSDYYIPLISSTQPCNNQQEIMLSASGKISYCRACAPGQGYQKKWFRIISPDMQLWMAENNIPFEKIPEHNPDCEVLAKGAAPSIHSPSNGMEYLISKKNPEPLQLVCKTANDVTKVYWYINDRFYKSCAPGEKQFFLPTDGPVKISCTDDKGRTRHIRIQVRYVGL